MGKAALRSTTFPCRRNGPARHRQRQQYQHQHHHHLSTWGLLTSSYNPPPPRTTDASCEPSCHWVQIPTQAALPSSNTCDISKTANARSLQGPVRLRRWWWWWRRKPNRNKDEEKRKKKDSRIGAKRHRMDSLLLLLVSDHSRLLVPSQGRASPALGAMPQRPFCDATRYATGTRSLFSDARLARKKTKNKTPMMMMTTVTMATRHRRPQR